MEKILPKIHLVIAFAALSCMALKCKPSDTPPPTSTTTQYTMQFNLMANSTPLLTGQTVTNSGHTRYYFDKLRFYMGFPQLVKTDGTVVPMSNLCIVALDKYIPYNSIYSNTFTFSVPVGNYKAVRFGIGIPPAINDTISHYHYGSFDPLNQIYGTVWPGNVNVFRQITMEMYTDTSKAQNQTPSRFLSFHLLEDGDSLHTLNLYHDLEFDKTFTIGSGSTVVQNFNLDANQIFFPAGNLIDLNSVGSTDMFWDDKTGISIGVQLDNNFAKAITIQ